MLVFALLTSVFLTIAALTAAGVLYLFLDRMGVIDSVNTLLAEVTQDSSPTGEPTVAVSAARVVGGLALLGVANIVLTTVLATAGAVLYNAVAAITGGVGITLLEQDG